LGVVAERCGDTWTRWPGAGARPVVRIDGLGGRGVQGPLCAEAVPRRRPDWQALGVDNSAYVDLHFGVGPPVSPRGRDGGQPWEVSWG